MKMKKNIEWLKKGIEVVLYRANLRGTLPVAEGNLIYDDIVSQIDQLDEPKITELDALNRLAQNVQFSADEIANHLEKLSAHNGQVTYGNQEILSQELPVIPKFVAEWYESEGKRSSWWNWFYKWGRDESRTELESKTIRWMQDYNEEKFVDIFRYGYEVEEEPKYIIEVSDGLYLSQPLGDTSNNEIVMTWSKEQAYKFKDEESIEGHLLKFKGSMAKPVDEVGVE